jgi:hypothetical protein
MPTRFNAAFTALLAAALFGATSPLAKALLGSLSPFLLAGLFYLGSGTGLAAVILARRLKGHADEPRHFAHWKGVVTDRLPVRVTFQTARQNHGGKAGAAAEVEQSGQQKRR